MKKLKRILLFCVVLTSFNVAQTVDGGFNTNINGSIYEITLFANMQSDSGTAGVLTLEFTFNDTALNFASNPVDGIDYQLQGDFSNYTTKNITRPLPNRVRVNLLTTSTTTPPLVQLFTFPRDIVKLNFNIINYSLNSNLIWKTTSIAPLFLQNPYTIGNWLNSNILLPVENVLDLLPEKTVFYQNYPNPFNFRTLIKYYVANSGIIKLKLFFQF